MFLVFRLHVAGSGRRLLTIDYYSERKYTDYNKNRKIGMFSSCKDFPIITHVIW